LALPNEIIIQEGEARILRNMVFEGFSGDFVIKNYGTLIVENCTFRNNILGSTGDSAQIGVEKVVAPIINHGKLTIINSVFGNNYSRNTALTDNFVAQPAAGAVVNFGELTMVDNNTFQNNLHQQGHFVVIRNEGVQRIAYLGNDTIFNLGTVENIAQNAAQNNVVNTLFEAAIMENPVSNIARILVNTTTPTNVNIAILNHTGSVVFSTNAQVQNSRIFEWDLRNSAGQRVPPETYLVRIQAGNFMETLRLGVSW
jgi:hypothetical protein